MSRMDDHLTHDAGWGILWLNSVLLIPLIFAAFFYPIPVLVGTVVGAVLLWVMFLGAKFVIARLPSWDGH